MSNISAGPLLFDNQNIETYEHNNILEKIEQSKYSIALKNNYRLHKNIVRIISDLFYFNQGLTCMRSDSSDTNIIFLNHNEREKVINFSRYNDGDEMAVCKALNILKEKNFQECAIGIITFYKGAQAKLAGKFPGVEVSTVDGYQGREKEAVIIVTTRNNAEKNIGFLENYRRVNVAITRATNFVVLVGNLDILSENYIFSYIIDRSYHY